MTTTIMAETCNICAGSLKWTERTESQDPEVPGEPSTWGEIIWDKGEGYIQERRRPIRPRQLVRNTP